MPLTLILGRVGCGKTAYMAEEIARRIDDRKEKITLLVPDQYTVASEQYFLDKIGEKRFRYLNVTSLKSLARTEFSAHGIPARFLGEGGKTVLLKKAFDAVAPSLKHYPPTYRNPRFLPLLLGAIKELKAAGISADELMETAKKEKNDKLYDLAMIAQVYEGYLSEGYFDPDDAPARLKKLLEATGDFENELVYVANFRTFYNRERNILLQMVKNGAYVTVALPTDTTDPEQAGPTADAAEEARKLIAYCRRTGEECRVVNLQKNAAFSSEEFALLESEYARPTEKTWEGIPKYLHLYCGSDRFDEAEFAASVIAKKVREEGYRYGDFTLIVRSLDDYAGILDPVFDQYEIPLFYHRKTPLRQRNPIPLITSLFSMAVEGFSTDAVLSFVKSGFVCTPEEGSRFERYVNVWGIRYNRFKTPFTRPIAGYTDRETEEEILMRNGAETLRKKVVNTVETLKSRSQNATVREISTALYEILETLQIPEALNRNAETYREYGEYELSARQKKVYEQLILALDEMVLTAGNDKITLKEYRDLFFSVIDTHDVAILPTSLDEVTAGSPETLPMISPRCVFILGLNEGVFPKNIDDNRLLTDKDREQLSPFGMGETTDDKILHEMFYVYLSLTAPREELYLSYASVIGGEASPSAVVGRILEIFPDLPTQRLRLSEQESLQERIQRERAAFALHTKTPVEELGAYFSGQKQYADLLARRERIAPLTSETALQIYPKHLRLSASKADKYHQCRYAYFLRYGLGISPRSRAELDPRQRGTIIHEALESIISQGLDCSDEELHQRVRDFGQGQIYKFYGDETPPPTVQSYFDALMKKIERLLTLFRKEFQASQFVPYAFEQRVGIGQDAVESVKIPLETGTLSMIGVVDRVDLFEKDGKKYLRVVDYKTGKKDFSFQLIQNGIDIQMLMYLYALQQNLFPGEVCIPAGVQYIGSNPKTVSGKRSDPEEKVLLQWESETPRSGVYLKDPAVLHAMDNTEERKFLRIKQNDSPFFITAEQFGKLFGQISDLLQKMGNALHEGKVEKNPIRIGSAYCSCNYCDLKDYCRHETPRDVFAVGKEKPDAQVD
ncbi:MAG: PD-(D/E)XK nuclease family protein [Clostridia bacterium]|nr:PD-(D/E)XK nuclease family protein [Clostridia bacterium]